MTRIAVFAALLLPACASLAEGDGRPGGGAPSDGSLTDHCAAACEPPAAGSVDACEPRSEHRAACISECESKLRDASNDCSACIAERIYWTTSCAESPCMCEFVVPKPASNDACLGVCGFR